MEHPPHCAQADDRRGWAAAAVAKCICNFNRSQIRSVNDDCAVCCCAVQDRTISDVALANENYNGGSTIVIKLIGSRAAA